MNKFNRRLSMLMLTCGVVLPAANADQIFNDDVLVTSSLCVGTDCVNGENFNFDTIRLKENNVRIKFDDTSTSSSFPNNDWQITANESANGGVNMFSIDDVTGTKTPFTIIAGAPSHSIFINSAGNMGMGTATPVVEVHVKDGNSPTLRLEQDGSSGFAAQSWDIGGNETNFFIRDVDNSSRLPFRIRTAAPQDSIHIASDGDIGFETSTPDGQIDVAHYSNANDHAFLISPISHVGINIANGYLPLGLFDVSTAAGQSSFLVQSNGNVGFGTGSTAVVGRFDVRSLDASKYYLNVNDSGNVGIGTSTPTGRFDVRNSAGTATVMSVTDSGSVAYGQSTGYGTYSSVTEKYKFNGDSGTHVGITLNSPDPATMSALMFSKTDVPQWYLSSRNDVFGDRFVIYDKTPYPVITLEQGGKIGFGVASVNASYAIEHSSGAHLTTGGDWMSVSSREFKDNIEGISIDAAREALESLNPVTYHYKADPDDSRAGFIAEDVPEMVASKTRKHLSALDIVAVLTKVLQDQQETIDELNSRLQQVEQSNTEQ